MDVMPYRVPLTLWVPSAMIRDLVYVCDAHGFTPSDAIEWLVTKEAYSAGAALEQMNNPADPDFIADPMSPLYELEA